MVGCLVYVGGGGRNSRYFSADNDIITVSRHVPLFLTIILNICRMCVWWGWVAVDLQFKDNLLAQQFKGRVKSEEEHHCLIQEKKKTRAR